MAKQLINPDLSIKANTGWCLWFGQEVYAVPHLYPSAWKAWQATRLKHTDRNLPDVSVPVWFSHHGSYGNPPFYDNWGHVVAYMPNKGFFSSPANGYGNAWLGSIEEVERVFNCKFVGWSEDISGVRVADVKGENMINGDIDNLLKDYGITPTKSDYNATKLNGKDFAYWLQKRLRQPLVRGDVDNLLKDVGITPTAADYKAVEKMNPKDFTYYLQARLKKLTNSKTSVMAGDSYSKENNALLKQILSIVQAILAKLTNIFK